MNVNVVCTIFVVLMHIEIFVWAQEPCTPWIYHLEFQKCYRKYCDVRKFEDAQKVCQQQGGNLVTVCNEAENNFVGFMARVATAYPNEVYDRTWIGLRRNPNNRKQWQWMSGSTCNFSSWAAAHKEPNDFNGNEDYVHLYSNYEYTYYEWNDISDWPFHYICERSTCPQEDVD
ncbi:C-type lectin domain-containing protein [Trichostrongylus colubriformis]|uniref:C-type lectin domain-containing protein n=1 Tax=Trichostrongylus colubriformis TaxID=6319 RepID=A0AAN8EU76_TRICO